MRRDEWRARLTELVQRFEAQKCECRRTGRQPCKLLSTCAYDALLDEGARLIVQLRQFGLRDARIAGYAGTNRPNISRWAGGRTDPRLGIAGLSRGIDKLREALADTRANHLMMSMPSAAAPVKTLDFCANHGATDSVKEEANDTLRSNLISIVLDRAATNKKPLPKGINAHVAQLGDPAYNIFVIQCADPTGSDNEAIIEMCDNIIHELDHIIERFKDRRDRLDRKVRRKRPPPPLRLS